MFKVGDRVYAKPYDCFGTVAKVEWRKELKLTDNSSIPSAYVYWVELEGKDLKPRGFSKNCLSKAFVKLYKALSRDICKKQQNELESLSL